MAAPTQSRTAAEPCVSQVGDQESHGRSDDARQKKANRAMSGHFFASIGMRQRESDALLKESTNRSFGRADDFIVLDK